MRFWVLASLLLLTTNFVQAEDALDGFDDMLDGFSEIEAPTPSLQKSEQQNRDALSFKGEVSTKFGYGYREHSVDGVSYSGLNQAQLGLYLQLDYKIDTNWELRVSGDGFYDAFYTLHKQDYNADVIDTYETQLRFDDVYIQGSLSKNVDVKLGRQIVVWGKSDSIRITNVINPLDNRLPGITDIKDLRLPTSMAKLDYYSGAWNLSAMAIFESRIFLEPAVRGEFFPVDAVFPNAPRPFIELKEPQSSFEEMQYALALNGIFSGWDLSFYASHVYDSRWHLEGTLPDASRVVSHIDMLGAATNIALGSWLIKSEFAYIDSLRYNSTKKTKSRLDALLGFDYMGFDDTQISLELANRHIFSYEAQMSGYTPGFVPDYVQEDEVQTAIRYTRDFMHDTLTFTAFATLLGHNWEFGGFFRNSLEYEVNDNLNATVGFIDYIEPANSLQKPFTASIADNDRVFVELIYSF